MLELSDHAKGYLAVLGSILFFGSFAVPLKSRRVEEANVDPVIFQLYYSIAVFALSWLVLTYNPFVFTYLGIASAALWVPASILSIAAINHLGMSVAVGMWAGVTIVVSFLWGAIAFPKENPVHNIGLSVLALIFLITGILGLSLSNTSFVKNLGNKRRTINHHEETPYGHGEESPLLETAPQTSKKRPIVGVICAVLLGIMNGSMLVPNQYAPANVKGAHAINFVVSFGIGVMCVTPVIAFIYFLVQRRRPNFQVKVVMLPGLCAGVFWFVGYFCSIYASNYLGLTIGYPLTQLALVVSGLWGLLVFKELKGARTILCWVVSLVVLLGGAGMLAVFG
eukprot:TRINITY_DN7058_c0_g1_i1.p1 TRINITY_DN7058_c0_g1~~TRINITY_DN7058_c0_g1_i1.p1  ORF type:complete len:338 (-),score=36.71 TRINITY_DN7058_c0_g1_i1:250-1263(-)